MLEPYSMGAVKINKGTHVYVRVADGNTYPGRSTAGITDVFVGIAYETIDNSTGVVGAVQIRVWKAGSFYMLLAAAAQTAVGAPAYGADDQTVTLASGSTVVLTGYISEIPDANGVYVRIDRAVQ